MKTSIDFGDFCSRHNEHTDISRHFAEVPQKLNVEEVCIFFAPCSENTPRCGRLVQKSGKGLEMRIFNSLTVDPKRYSEKTVHPGHAKKYSTIISMMKDAWVPKCSILHKTNVHVR